MRVTRDHVTYIYMHTCTETGLTSRHFDNLVRTEPIGRVIFFFFQKKKQKALVLHAEDPGLQTFREAEPRGLGLAPENRHYEGGILLFSEKGAKKFVLLRRKLWDPKPSAKRNNHGAWGWPQKTDTGSIL
jgi:hypothetical protein